MTTAKHQNINKNNIHHRIKNLAGLGTRTQRGLPARRRRGAAPQGFKKGNLDEFDGKIDYFEEDSYVVYGDNSDICGNSNIFGYFSQ